MLKRKKKGKGRDMKGEEYFLLKLLTKSWEILETGSRVPERTLGQTLRAVSASLGGHPLGYPGNTGTWRPVLRGLMTEPGATRRGTAQLRPGSVLCHTKKGKTGLCGKRGEVASFEEINLEKSSQLLLM